MAVDRGDVKFTLAADDSQLAQAFAGLKAKADSASSGITNAFAGLKSPIGALGAVFATLGTIVATVFVDGIRDTIQMTEKSMDLARAMGITTNEARAAQMALKDIGADAGEFEGAAKGMVRQLAENEDKMKAMGLATRDASGNLRPLNDLVMDGIKVLGTYKREQTGPWPPRCCLAGALRPTASSCFTTSRWSMTTASSCSS